MPIRLYVDPPLAPAADFALPPAAARHAQVRRVQPGDDLVLFDGSGGEWPATVLAVARDAVRVRIGAAVVVDRELARRVTLAVAMPANDRDDVVVEKATELGVAVLQPLLAERSVLRLAGERAARRQAHWQALARAACEQCGRARVPVVEPVRDIAGFLSALPPAADGESRWLLTPHPHAAALAGVDRSRARDDRPVVCISGPEGGLTDAEEAAAIDAGFVAVGLGPRVLRAETAPLAVLAWLALNDTAADPRR